ncbi:MULTISPECIES: mechanosensitive ion channel family protein [Aphanothece]|uniref:mechanosensitive ion channel family protein n=1 Tax=Aphanothece TaxID=1121 RepID=UPI003984D31F
MITFRRSALIGILILTLVLGQAALAQEAADGASGRKPWWDLDRAQRCGRMWCSRVVSPQLPQLPGENGIVLAVMPQPQDTDDQLALRVEARSTAVSTSLQRLLGQLRARLAQEDQPTGRHSLGFWLDRQHKPRHPATPSLQVGVKNNTPVIYLPADEASKAPQITLVTLTEPDSLANGADLPSLASRWKGTLERAMSEALWGESLNRDIPGLRWAGALLSLGIGAAVVALCSHSLQGLYRLRRQSLATLQARGEQRNGASPAITANAPESLLSDQRLERQLRRRRILVKLLQVLRIAVGVMAIIITLHLFPSTRLGSAFLMKQSVGLPVIWIGVVLLEAVVVWALMRRLNRWAVDAQATQPDSRRPRMRLETNARVLRGSIAAGTTLLGLYLTVLLFGINPQILAGAGIVAVAFGFLARSLVEDLISGIRILASDRFAIGDSIAVNGHAGLVEAMNLVQTQLRGGEGEVVTIPNGMIRESINRSKDWARVNFEIDIAWGSDLERACAVLQEVAAQLARDPEWQEQILEPPQLLGVDRLEQSGVRLRLFIKTLPLKQWGVAREFRRRLKGAFDAAGIEPGIPQQLIRRPNETVGC